MIYAATPPLPPAVYRAARKPSPEAEPVWVWTAIVERGVRVKATRGRDGRYRFVAIGREVRA